MKRARGPLLLLLGSAALAAPGSVAGVVVGSTPAGGDDAARTPPSFDGVYGVDTGAGDDDQSPPAEPGADLGDGNIPASHTVRKGDTLWRISEGYFRDPWRWPKLWAQNPEIANPHWIFPGQTIRLREAAAPPPPVAAAAPPPQQAEPSLPPSPAAPAAETYGLRQLGLVDEGTLAAAGVINGSLEEKILLASGDHAYVEFPSGRPLKGGARYAVYQVDREHPVRSPGSSIVLGYIVHVYGETVIDGVSDRPIADAHLVNLAEPVERGYQVGPLSRQFKSVAPRTNAAGTTARIVASVEPNMLIANQMFVVLDRGRRHGVEVGNRFLVLRQGDGYVALLDRWDASDNRFPPHAVAEILAVDVQAETTVGWISRGSRELHTGDIAELRRGY